MSSKKYSREFKLKVLEYYFEHGGDKKFGLKTKTAHHFCMDHKTVSRMLCNPEMVKKARRMLGKKNGTDGCKTTKQANLKLGQPYVDVKKMNVNLGSRGSQNPSPSSSKSSQPSKKASSLRTSEVPIIELPEDPDYSILKSPIDSSASSVMNVAKLLITGTEEVKRIISNECDLVYECKVCRNLFRSVINFLAHKRIYCETEYANVKGLFHKDIGLNMTTESSTVIVEPEPPPPESPPIIQVYNDSALKVDQIASRLAKNRTKKPDELASHPSHKGSSDYFRRIEEVNNARRSLGSDCSVILKDIAGVSSAVYQAVNPVGDTIVTKRTSSHQRKRERPVQLHPDGKVIERERGSDTATLSIKVPIAAAAAAAVCKEEVDDEETEVNLSCSSCVSTFSSQKLLDSHIEEVHGIERTVYTCPICNMIFLSIWGCVKHLIRIHKKKKHQRERLKHVICSRAYKKIFTAKEIARQNHKGFSSQATKAVENNEDAFLEKEDEKESSPRSPNSFSSLQDATANENDKSCSLKKEGQPKEMKENVSRVGVPVEEEPSGYIRNKAPVLPNTCPRCMQSFHTQTAMGAHLQFCSLASLASSSETPEKKIAIQIRKNYKKDGAVLPLSDVHKDDAGHSQVVVKVSKNQELMHLKIQERLRDICLLKRRFCIPCKKRYNTIHVLKRHVSQHIGWTRFSCTLCSFRHYEKYLVTEHCITAHKYNENKAELVILQEDNLDNPICLRPSKEVSDDANNGPVKSMLDENSKKLDCIQNGDCASSECSASVISEDSLSIKSEFENQDLESADVAYRELIENIDISAENKNLKAGSKERRNSDAAKVDRPHRTRRVIEQKDFVYEPLRSPSIGSRIDRNDGKNDAEGEPRQRSMVQQVIVKVDRSSKRKETLSDEEPAKKKPCARVLNDILPHYNHCNGRDSHGVSSESTEKPLSKSSVNCSSSQKKDTLQDTGSDIQKASTKANPSPEKISIKDTEGSSSDRKITEIKVYNLPELCEHPVKDEAVRYSKAEKVTQIIRKIEVPVLKTKEGCTEFKICKVKTIDAATAKEQFKSKSVTLIEVKANDQLEAEIKDQTEPSTKDRVESETKEQSETKINKNTEVETKENNANELKKEQVEKSMEESGVEKSMEESGVEKSMEESGVEKSMEESEVEKSMEESGTKEEKSEENKKRESDQMDWKQKVKTKDKLKADENQNGKTD